MRTLDQTLEASRQMVVDLLDSGAPGVVPGDLVRAQPAPTSAARVAEEPREPAGGRVRVILADDSADVRMLVRARHPALRIVVLSGYPTDAMRAMALAAGADDYIEKGPDLRAVEDAVRVGVAG